MKKKLIILISLLFLLCGCTAEVNITIEDLKIKENINIDAFPDAYYNKEQLPEAFRKYIPIYADVPIIDTMPDEKEDNILYYNRTLTDIGTGYRFTYNYNFDINKYNQARSIKSSFKSSTVQVNKKDKEILLSTDSNTILFFNDYPSLTEITINIKTAYPVKENNADEVNNDTYTWHFTKDVKKNIYLLMDSEIKKENNQTVESKKETKEQDSAFIKFINEHPFITAIIAIAIFILAVVIISRITRNKY